jgi:uncharacterized membrane protein
MPTTIDVSPLEIVKTVKRGETYEETLTVRNVSDERYAFRVDAEEAYRSWVDSDPNLFAINAQEQRAITLELRPPQQAKIGVHRFKTKVINDDKKDDQAEVDVALKVPIPAYWWLIIAAVIVIIVLVIVVLSSSPG